MYVFNKRVWEIIQKTKIKQMQGHFNAIRRIFFELQGKTNVLKLTFKCSFLILVEHYCLL